MRVDQVLEKIEQKIILTIKKEALMEDIQAIPLMIVMMIDIEDPLVEIKGGKEGIIKIMINIKEDLGQEVMMRDKGDYIRRKIIIDMKIAIKIEEDTTKEKDRIEIDIMIEDMTEIVNIINLKTDMMIGETSKKKEEDNMKNHHLVKINLNKLKKVIVIQNKEKDLSKIKDISKKRDIQKNIQDSLIAIKIIKIMIDIQNRKDDIKREDSLKTTSDKELMIGESNIDKSLKVIEKIVNNINLLINQDRVRRMKNQDNKIIKELMKDDKYNFISYNYFHLNLIDTQKTKT